MPPEFLSPSPIPAEKITTTSSEPFDDSHDDCGQLTANDSSDDVDSINTSCLDSPMSDWQELVISGISGKFPESENLEEFQENLFNGVDMVADDGRRFTPGLYGLPRHGKLKQLDKFDASFFGVHQKQADRIDPQLRILLELTHEALIDAGVNPSTIRGSKTGVFIGVSNSESSEKWIENPNEVNGYELTGTCKAMFANRISFTFDLKGPSFAIDTACSSSLLAVDQAVSAIRGGHCDAAIVGGVNLCLKPTVSLQFHRLSMLSPDGKSKAFDASANGYARSEAAVVIYICPANQAVRSYATIVHAKTNTDGHKNEGVTYPSGSSQKNLLQQTYSEAGVSPGQVAYVEAHGTGTKVGDPLEVNAISEIFCKDRLPDRPLLIGSVKTNMGHSEPASGLCSIAKIILAMREGVIPGNLHFQNPNPEIPALLDGRLKVVDENMKWDGGFVGVNSFGFGGVNVHVILKSNPRTKSKNPPPLSSSQIPLLIPFSGRTQQSVEFALQKIAKKSADLELTAVLQEIAQKNIPGHKYRGFLTIKEDNEVKNLVPQVCQLDSANLQKKPPVWLIFSGMGTQWPGMGRLLMRFPIFEKSIKKSATVLKNNEIDLIQILETGNEDTFQNVLNCFVSIAAIQVALVDLLGSLGVVADGGLVGHSVGELGCAYADGCLSAEQTVLAAFARGKSILESNLVDGAMAAVGLGWEDAKSKCPADIFPACHNSKDSVTVSGPSGKIEEFAQSLTQQGIFARPVNSAGQAFHSCYMDKAGPTLKNYLEKIIPHPKPRSDLWFSSSTATTTGQQVSLDSSLASADYFVNNLLSPVLFHEALEAGKIPENAVVIEVAPHGLLQAILRRSLPSTKSILSVMNKSGAEDNELEHFVLFVGKIYNFGLNPKFSHLYDEKIQFPVSMETPSIGSLVQWDHGDCWSVANFDPASSASNNNNGSTIFEIDLTNESDEFYKGHTIDGRILFPAAGYIVLAWKSFSMRRAGAGGSTNLSDFEKVPIVIENLVIHRATVLDPSTPTKFFVTILTSSGHFQIEERDSLVVSGIVRDPINLQVDQELASTFSQPPPKLQAGPETLNSSHVSQLLRLIGMEASGSFKSIELMDYSSQTAQVTWTGNWVTYLDILLQLNSLYISRRIMHLPTGMQKIVIDPSAMIGTIENDENDDQTVTVIHHKNLKLAKSQGVEIRGISTSSKDRRLDHPPTMQMYEFTPFFPAALSADRAIRFFMSIVLDNTRWPTNMSRRLNVLEFLDDASNTISEQIDHFISLHLPQVTSKVRVRVRLGELSPARLQGDIDAAVRSDLIILHRPKFLASLATSDLKPHSFILYDGVVCPLKFLPKEFQIVAQTQSEDKKRHFCLLKMSNKNFQKENENDLQNFKVKSRGVCIVINPENFDWLDELKCAMAATENLDDPAAAAAATEKIYLLSNCGPKNGILGLALTLMQEQPGGHKIRCYFIKDEGGPFFENFDKFLIEQELEQILNLDLTINIYENGQWGSYCHYELDGMKTGNGISGLQEMVEHAALKMLKPGDLTSFSWTENCLKYSQNSQNLIEVYCAPLNFRDVMLATGKISVDAIPTSPNVHLEGPVFGLEFSGICKTTGKRVMGLAAEDQALATTASADPLFLWDIPPNWTMAEAATVPTVYCTVFYALIVRGGIQPGDSILIHSGAGGVGQAAIGVALSLKCQVFTTVGSPEKKKFLQKLFPQLEDHHFANSRDTTFEQHILTHTAGHGVDLVLNSLAGDKLLASLRCLGVGGRFLEIGKADIIKDSLMGMGILIKNVDIQGVHLDHLLKNKRTTNDKQKVAQLMTQGLTSGLVKPLQRTVFGLDEIEPAFRFMASGKHRGKIVIQIRKEIQNVQRQSNFLVEATKRSFFHPEKIYILIGGLGGVGLEMSQWLIDRGVKNLALVGRSGVTTAYQRMCLREWRGQNGVVVMVSQADVTSREGAKNFLEETKEFFGGGEVEVGGIFNLAMVLKDSLLENQTVDHFEVVGRSKILTTKSLDEATRLLGMDLDHFVVFSSVAAAKGNPGQSSYSFANSMAERICEERRKDGLAGLAIQWGAIGDVGVIFEQLNLDNETAVGGTKPQRIRSLLSTLDEFLLRSSSNSNSKNGGAVLSSWIFHEDDTTDPEKNSVGPKTSLVEDVSRILGIKNLASANKTCQLSDMGMDSLQSMEIKLLLERHGLTVATDKIGQLTLTELMEMEGLKNSLHDTNLCGNNDSNFEDGENEFSLKKLDSNSVVWMAPTLMPRETIVRMESGPNLDESDETIPFLFFVHPVDGFVVSMEKLALPLKAHVYGLQCVKEAPLESIESLAAFYIEKIKSVKSTGPISLIAYSFGGPIAVEISLQLQNSKENGDKNCCHVINLIFLDATHRVLDGGKGLGKFYEVKMNTPDAEAAAFCVFMLCFLEFEYRKLREHIRRIGTFEGRQARAVELLAPAIPQFSKEEIGDAILSFYQKLMIAYKYKVNGKLIGSRVILLKTVGDYGDEVPYDYGLAEICNQPVEVHEVGGSHLMMTREPHVHELAQIFSQIDICSLHNNDHH